MLGDTLLKLRWEKLVQKLTKQFSDGDTLDIQKTLYLLGVQELGHIHTKFKKDDKINLIHIAICRVLEPYGFYEFQRYDEDGWPHYKIKEQLPALKGGEQTLLMKEAIVNYFLTNGYIE